MKEAIHSPYNKLVKRITLNDEQTLRKGGGTPTDVTFANGKGTFNGTSSKVNYNLGLNGTYSVRVRCNPTSFAAVRYLIDCRGTNNDGIGRIRLDTTTGLVDTLTGTVYVNGAATTTTVVGANNEIVITGVTLTQGTGANLSLIGSSRIDTDEFLGTIDLVEIYKGTLTASEVANLYNDRWNKEQSFGGEPKSNGIPATSSTFDDDSWWQKTDDITISGGTGNLVNADSGYGFYKTGYSTIGKKYRITYSITSYTDGNIRVQLGTDGIGINRSAVGTYTEDITASGNTQLYFVSQTENTNLSIDNVSVQELNPLTLIDFDSTNGVIEDRTVGNAVGDDLVTDGEFNNALNTSWTTNGDWTIEGGSGAVFTYDGTLRYITQPMVLANNTLVRLKFTVLAATGSGANIKFTNEIGDLLIGGIYAPDYPVGTYVLYFTSVQAATAIRIYANTNSCTLDNLSITEVRSDLTITDCEVVRG